MSNSNSNSDVAAGSITPGTAAGPRDLSHAILYTRPRATKEYEGPPLPADATDQERGDAVSDRPLRRIVDARTAQPRGTASWDLDTHGFTFAAPPPHPLDLDFADARVVEEEYAPKLVELAKQMVGAKNAYFYQYIIRGSDPAALNIHASFAHSDYGPTAVPQLRQDLVERFGVPEEDARSCELAC